MQVFLSGLFEGCMSADAAEFKALIMECHCLFAEANLDKFEWVSDALAKRYIQAQSSAAISIHTFSQSLSAFLPVCGCSSSSSSSSSSVVDNAPSTHKQDKKKKKKKPKKKKKIRAEVAEHDAQNREERNEEDETERKAEETEKEEDEKSVEKSKRDEQKLDSREQAAMDARGEREKNEKKKEKGKPEEPEDKEKERSAEYDMPEERVVMPELCANCANAKHTGEGWCKSLQCAFLRGYDIVESLVHSLGSFAAQLQGDKSEFATHVLPLYSQARITAVDMLSEMSLILRYVHVVFL